jgi:FolB domain-containing protein
MKTKKKNNVIEIFEKPLISTLVRKILIKNLTINAIFGYYPKEKVKSQLELTNKIKFNDTDLRSIVDYDNIIKTINNILDKKINFLETLGELVAEEILKNKKIDAIELQIEKLDILKKDASVGFEISKRKV